ncbi:hypothetical protein ACTQZK_10615, partial [Paraeggerthella sp. LCP19S3_G8]|uniref:hypothetical protein n=1 Tax=Paraeggerthella sp. LCP19S3_G8 TaxID=3440248 RepID=UPI003F9A3F91
GRIAEEEPCRRGLREHARIKRPDPEKAIDKTIETPPIIRSTRLSCVDRPFLWSRSPQKAPALFTRGDNGSRANRCATPAFAVVAAVAVKTDEFCWSSNQDNDRRQASDLACCKTPAAGSPRKGWKSPQNSSVLTAERALRAAALESGRCKRPFASFRSKLQESRRILNRLKRFAILLHVRTIER